MIYVVIVILLITRCINTEKLGPKEMCPSNAVYHSPIHTLQKCFPLRGQPKGQEGKPNSFLRYPIKYLDVL